MSDGGQRGTPRPDARAAAGAEPPGAPGQTAGGDAPTTGRGSPTTGAAHPTTGAAHPTTGAGSPTTGAGAPISVTGTASEAEWPGAAARAELLDRPVALTALALVAAVLLAEGYLAAGPAGFVVAGTVLALVAILFARAAMPRGEEAPPSAAGKDQPLRGEQRCRLPRPTGRSPPTCPGRSRRRGTTTTASGRGWPGCWTRGWPSGTGSDAAAQPERARELLGAELWPLLDTSRPPSNDSRAPGVSMATVDRIVTRLEEL